MNFITRKLYLNKEDFKKSYRGFPGGSVVKNLPANAGDTSSVPHAGRKIPHAVEQVSPRTTTTGPAL